jgi:YHS domain-containing protein
VQIEAAGLSPEELALSVTSKIHRFDSDPLTPEAKIIEGGSDMKGLLSEGIEPEDGTLPRQWSLWRTTDPVSLKTGQVIPGAAEFACHYANNVFVFQSEENLKAFVANPRYFLSAAPEMPSDYRIMMTGPRGSGFHTQAKKLEEHYGWRVVDFTKIVKTKLNEILQMPTKPPNNIT